VLCLGVTSDSNPAIVFEHSIHGPLAELPCLGSLEWQLGDGYQADRFRLAGLSCELMARHRVTTWLSVAYWDKRKLSRL
jgi:hypothetical protein